MIDGLSCIVAGAGLGFLVGMCVGYLLGHRAGIRSVTGGMPRSMYDAMTGEPIKPPPPGLTKF